MTVTNKDSLLSRDRKSALRGGLTFYNSNNQSKASSYIHSSSEQIRLLKLRAMIKNGKLA